MLKLRVNQSIHIRISHYSEDWVHLITVKLLYSRKYIHPIIVQDLGRDMFLVQNYEGNGTGFLDCRILKFKITNLLLAQVLHTTCFLVSDRGLGLK